MPFAKVENQKQEQGVGSHGDIRNKDGAHSHGCRLVALWGCLGEVWTLSFPNDSEFPVASSAVFDSVSQS